MSSPAKRFKMVHTFSTTESTQQTSSSSAPAMISTPFSSISTSKSMANANNKQRRPLSGLQNVWTCEFPAPTQNSLLTPQHQIVPQISMPSYTESKNPFFNFSYLAQMSSNMYSPAPSCASPNQPNTEQKMKQTFTPNYTHQNYLPSPQPSIGRLPGGFCMLTPEPSNTPVCRSVNPSPQTSFSFISVNPITLPPTTRPRLTASNVAALEKKDSRQFRWDRVVGYVSAIRRAHNPTLTWIAAQRMDTNTPVDLQSLWDGGSCGTDGVDEFVWDDDLDEMGRRFTIPPKDEPESTMFHYEDGEADLIDLESERPAKRSRSAERQVEDTVAGMREYINALKAFEMHKMPEVQHQVPVFA